MINKIKIGLALFFILIFIITWQLFSNYQKNWLSNENNSLLVNESVDPLENDSLIRSSLEVQERKEEGDFLDKTNLPLERASERVTKKPFGILINPDTSPVQPERFRGYHTGTDFEVFPEETKEKVMVFAICTGEILAKQKVVGYGGVVVQKCQLKEEDVTVLYGHIALDDTLKKVGDQLIIGEKFAVLGAGESSDTDGERKHLHLGIHRGAEIVLAGYVERKELLRAWIDWELWQELI
ncbi:MAG TPA: peptidoglycan DD-metalloendopeptidase family protein [Candidatus Moranbacteria bacterium]|nr:peptidoglycan DD-metalloendopeptidase family protein [Candidatus Moranbacteria bacterium]